MLESILAQFIVTHIFPLVIAAIMCTIFIPYLLIEDKYILFAHNNSYAINELRAINKNYIFYAIGNYDIRYHYDNDAAYNSISCTDYLTYRLTYIQNDVLHDIDNVAQNKTNYENYLEATKVIINFGRYKNDIGKLKLSRLNKAERKAFNNNLLHPVTEFGITVTLVRTNARYEYKRSKSQRFNEKTIKELIRKLNERSGKFYLYNDIWDSLCRVEKGKLDRELTYAVFRKDGVKCCYCGSQKHLVVDYRKPVSIGGKSALNNLRTLCKSCQKKRDAKLKKLLNRKVEGEYGYIPEEWR